MAGMREGGCLCGAVRYRVEGEQVKILRGELIAYEHRSDETGRWLRFEFCPKCGTQVTWTVEAMPGLRAIGVGTLDDPKSVKPQRFGWFRSAHPWVRPPEGVEVVQTSALPPPSR